MAGFVFRFRFKINLSVLVAERIQAVGGLGFDFIGKLFKVQHTMLNHAAEIERHLGDAVGVNFRIQRAALIVDAVDGIFVWCILKSLNNRNTKSPGVSINVLGLESFLFEDLEK